MACAATLAACGQKGPLFLPSSPAASGRATLPQTLGISSPPEQGAAAAPAQAAPAPAPTPAAAPGSGAQDSRNPRAD